MPLGAREYSTDILFLATLLAVPESHLELDDINHFLYVHRALLDAAKNLVEYLSDESNKENNDPHSDVWIESIAPTGPRSILVPRPSTLPPTTLEEEGFELYDPGQHDLYPLTVYNFTNQRLEPTTWVKIYDKPDKTMIKGTFGFGNQRYKQRLRLRPYLAPNFTNPSLFWDDYLEIFRANHQSRQLVDQAIQQLQDPGQIGRASC